MLKWMSIPLLLGSVGAYAADTVTQQPASVNAGLGAGSGFQGVVLSSAVTRSAQSGITVNVYNSCFGTNLRYVDNPVSPSGIIHFKFSILDRGVTKSYEVKYSGSLVTESGKDTAIAIPSSAITSPTGSTMTGAVYGNVVRLQVPAGITVSVDANGNISQTEVDAAIQDISFVQEFSEDTIGNRGVYAGPYYKPGMKASQNGQDYRGYNGELSATVAKTVSKDLKNIALNVSFPGEFGFCGGYFSPLMVFFGKELPKFSAKVSFPLNPTGITNWPEKGSKASFIVVDHNGDGKITKADELFGTAEGKFQNGFEALREYDSNKDGVIDAQDKDFNKLMLWTDANADGITQKSELVPLKSKIKSISLKYESGNVTAMKDRAEARERSSFVFIENGKEKTGEVIDMWFAAGK